jgi:S-adenosyl methyltransferase
MPGKWYESAAPGDVPPRPDIDPSVPHIARIYDYWLGGKDNFAADRRVAEEILELAPGTVQNVRANRAFLGRVVRYLADQEGIRQFLDIGTGVPAADNTHEVAQSVAPECRVVYVDNDPIVLAHARALLTSPDGMTAYVDADIREPGKILAEAAGTLDLRQPVAVMMLAVLHVIDDDDDPYGIVARTMEALPPGSYLAISHGASDINTEVMADVAGRLKTLMPPGQKPAFRDRAEVLRLFSGLDLLEPGVVPLPQWRPAEGAAGGGNIPMWAGVARKPPAP